jgi:hypothetical protein
MRGLHFSLYWLFGIVAFAATACAWLIYASWFLSEVLGAALGAFLICAALGGVYGRGANRAFWGGCAIAGCSYVASMYLPNVLLPLPDDFAYRMLSRLYDVVSRELPARQQNGLYPEGTYFAPGGAFVKSPSWEPFIRAGNALVAFVVAVLGGIVASRFHRRGEPTRPK